MELSNVSNLLSYRNLAVRKGLKLQFFRCAAWCAELLGFWGWSLPGSRSDTLRISCNQPLFGSVCLWLAK